MDQARRRFFTAVGSSDVSASWRRVLERSWPPVVQSPPPTGTWLHCAPGTGDGEGTNVGDPEQSVGGTNGPRAWGTCGWWKFKKKVTKRRACPWSPTARQLGLPSHHPKPM